MDINMPYLLSLSQATIYCCLGDWVRVLLRVDRQIFPFSFYQWYQDSGHLWLSAGFVICQWFYLMLCRFFSCTPCTIKCECFLQPKHFIFMVKVVQAELLSFYNPECRRSTVTLLFMSCVSSTNNRVSPANAIWV